MGSLFSRSLPLQTSLLEEEISLMCGDIVLVQSSDLEICMNGHIFAHVAIVCFDGFESYAFHDGNFERLSEYIARHEQIQIRCISRAISSTVIVKACKNVQDVLMVSNVNINEREALTVSMVLQELCLLTTNLLSPHLFANVDLPSHGDLIVFRRS